MHVHIHVNPYIYYSNSSQNIGKGNLTFFFNYSIYVTAKRDHSVII